MLSLFKANPSRFGKALSKRGSNAGRSQLQIRQYQLEPIAGIRRKIYS